jgi:spore coat protein H
VSAARHLSLLVLALTACESGQVSLTKESGAPTTETEAPPPTDTEVVDTDDTELIDTAPPEEDTAVDVVGTPPSCEPGGEAFGVEGEELTLRPVCTDVDSGETIEVVGGLPAGATWDPGAGVIRWTPGLADGGRWEVEVEATGKLGVESGIATLWVADAWDAPGNVAVDPYAYTYEHDLPVVHLTRPPSTNSSSYVDSTLIYRGHEFSIELKYRGAASLGYPKNSYTIKFPPEDEFEDDDEDFDKRRRIVLTTLFDDNSYVRQRLCYDIWNRLDADHHPVQTYHAVVFINGVYEGLYLLGDHIDGEYWEDQGYWEDGNLYKAVNHDANFYDKGNLAAGYEKKAGEPEGDFSDLTELVAFVARTDETTFRAELPGRVAVPEFMDWWALVRFTEAGDSAGKNSYLYNDPNDPMWHYAPWDFNHSIGQSWQTLRVSATSGDEFKGTNNLFKRMLEDDVLGPELLVRWRDHLENAVSAEELDGVIDDYIDRIDPSARRDWDKWESQYRTYGGWSWRNDWTTYDEEVDYVRSWVADRWAWLDGQYP